MFKMRGLFGEKADETKDSMSEQDREDLKRIKSHVLARLEEVPVGTDPFYHMWVDRLFPDDFYEELLNHMLEHKDEKKMQPRLQDNPEFANRRFNLVGNDHPTVRKFHAVWSDPEVMLACFRNFYSGGAEELSQSARIHNEFEYVYCQPGRFQNIHVDIPAKVLSFVFYLPSFEVSEDDEKKNATILYDKNLDPCYAARFRRNSVCIFAPHFYSYHGFSSTIERDALVMFLVEPQEIDRWKRLRDHETAPFEGILQAIDEKLERFTLAEYGDDPDRRKAEREASRINAPKGRVLVD
ncbi:hypothetical protein AADZ90_006125 [Aestuariibius sp. 2305UL40-4]|uniref:hypothetical protein n=1 Tax=Aestuariibius violaceus TaxID=3234132 RepID=UPI003497E8A0